MMFSRLVDTSNQVAGTTSRLRKVGAIAGLLPDLPPAEVPIAVAYLSGSLRQRRTGTGWAALRDVPEPAVVASLSIEEVDRVFAELESVSGQGSSATRREALRSLMARATGPEQSFIRGLVSGELRQGALAGIMTDAVAAAWEVPVAAVRRAAMLSGDLRSVAAALSTGGAEALSQFHLGVGIALQPMLAQSAVSVEQALERTGPASVEWKLDGVRVQAHKRAGQVEVFTRTLDVITDRVPEVVEAVRSLAVSDAILDGEAVALQANGRPHRFQVTGSRVATRSTAADLQAAVPLTVFFFDVLHRDGLDCIDLPLRERLNHLDAICPEDMRVPRVQDAGLEEAEAFAAGALAAGHEGVVVKALDSLY